MAAARLSQVLRRQQQRRRVLGRNRAPRRRLYPNPAPQCGRSSDRPARATTLGASPAPLPALLPCCRPSDRRERWSALAARHQRQTRSSQPGRDAGLVRATWLSSPVRGNLLLLGVSLLGVASNLKQEEAS